MFCDYQKVLRMAETVINFEKPTLGGFVWFLFFFLFNVFSGIFLRSMEVLYIN